MMPDILLDPRRMLKAYDAMLSKATASFGLSQIEITILSFLHNHPANDTAGQIAELRLLSKGHVSVAVESLIRKGYLDREPDAVDRRRIHLKMTPIANQITDIIDRTRQAFYDRLYSGLTRDEIDQYTRIQLKMLENITED